MLWLLPLLFLLSSCALGPGNFQTSHSSDLRARNIKRIAILPLGPIPLAEGTELPYSPLSGQGKEREKGVASVLSNHLYSTMSAMRYWQIVSDREVSEVEAMVPQGGAAARAKRLGELVYADAVILGRILRYHERVGKEWGAKSPASVAFVLDLWDVKRGDVVWSARFDETQKPLSENIFSLGEFTQRGARWLRAEELALEGIRKAVHRLHQALYPRPT